MCLNIIVQNKKKQIYINMEFTISKKRSCKFYISREGILPSRVARFVDSHCGV